MIVVEEPRQATTDRPEVQGVNVEALIKEARRRQRRRWLSIIARSSDSGSRERPARHSLHIGYEEDHITHRDEGDNDDPDVSCEPDTGSQRPTARRGFGGRLVHYRPHQPGPWAMCPRWLPPCEPRHVIGYGSQSSAGFPYRVCHHSRSAAGASRCGCHGLRPSRQVRLRPRRPSADIWCTSHSARSRGKHGIHDSD